MSHKNRLSWYLSLFFLISISLGSGVGTGDATAKQEQETPLAIAVDKAIDLAIRENRIVGCVVFVAHDGKIVVHRAAGFADRELKTPMQENVLFRLASVSKAFTSTAAAILIQQGKLRLDDPVTKYLPEFTPKLQSGEKATITVRQLMSHSAGLNYGFFEAEDGPYHKVGVSDGLDISGITLEENLKRIASVPLLFEPGANWHYSLATDVLGAVIAKANGTTLQVAVKTLVTDPLQMKETGFFVQKSDKNAERLATPYYNPAPNEGILPIRMKEPQTVNGVVFSPNRVFEADAYPSGGAGLVGTASDLLLLLEMLRKGGMPLINPEMMTEMNRNQLNKDSVSPGIGFGLGWAVIHNPKEAKLLCEPGTISWSGAYGHSWTVDPKSKLSIVILTNTTFEGMNGRFVDDVRNAVYDGVTQKQ